ncbi:uncharacterized protein [Antedon mediterranea]|uniref:uncharacterized protein n=1 Tax=Antedon mediterranea TaxID=105859 RepID=UPI003AF898A1
MYTNAWSLKNKADEFHCTLKKHNVDVAIVTETWLTEETQGIVNFCDYKGVFKNRTDKIGGGVACFAADHLEIHPIVTHTDCKFECLWSKISYRSTQNSKTRSIYIGAIYYPPSANYPNQLLEHVGNVIDSIYGMDRLANIIVLGDFNHLNTTYMQSELGMEQMIDFPTHRKNNILDKVFMNRPERYSKATKLAPLGRSDHCCILLKPIHVIPTSNYTTCTIQPYRNSSVRSFGSWITAHDWCHVLDSESTNEFLTVLNGKFADFFPVKSICHKKTDKPWMTPRIKRLIVERQLAFSSNHTQQWRRIRNSIQRAITHAKEKFYATSLKCLKSNSPARWHKGIVNLCNLKKKDTFNIPGLLTQAAVEVINQHFATICSELSALVITKLPSYLPASEPPPRTSEICNR